MARGRNQIEFNPVNIYNQQQLDCGIIVIPFSRLPLIPQHSNRVATEYFLIRQTKQYFILHLLRLMLQKCILCVCCWVNKF